MEKLQKIVEMAKDICRVKHICNDVCKPISACDALKYAERAVEAGYVKQSQGEWLVYRHPFSGGHEIWCSCCGSKDRKGPAWDITWGTHSFCPGCGAKMIGARYVEERPDKGGSDMEETKIFACDNGRSYRFPAKHCLFCDNCTHVLYDYTHGPYMWLCDIGEEDFRTCGKFKEEVE